MAAVVRSRSLSRSLSITGLIAIVTGIGLVFAVRKFVTLSYLTNSGYHVVLLSVSGVLILWGVWQLLTAVFPALHFRKVNKLNRNRIFFPRVGLAYLVIMGVIFVGSLLSRSNMLMLVFAMLIGPWVLNGWTAFTMSKRTRILRRAPQRAMAGETISVEMILENRKFWFASWLMAVRDRISNRHEQLDASVLFVRVPPRRSRNTYYQLQLSQRGNYRFGPLEVTTRFPLGLVERGLISDVEGEILIHPRIGRLTSNWKRDQSLSMELIQRQATRPGAYDDEFHCIREYRSGDNPRAIHWRTTARQNELMVKEFHQRRDQRLAVLLDLWQPSRLNEQYRARIELAVSFVATVCVDHLRQARDSRLYLAVSGDELNHWVGQLGPSSVESMLDALAVVKGGPSNDFSKMINDCRADATSETRILLVTTRDLTNPEFDGINLPSSNGKTDEVFKPVQMVEASTESLAPHFIISKT